MRRDASKCAGAHASAITRLFALGAIDRAGHFPQRVCVVDHGWPEEKRSPGERREHQRKHKHAEKQAWAARKAFWRSTFHAEKTRRQATWFPTKR
jgi:hypothetical protein